jgi:UDP-N-acetylmuramyl pentapeptide phosphotransferase/UDP-N-acetylglucosamine-1-phosphate transferase
MDKIFLSTGLSFIITFFSIPVIIQVAKDKRLFDEPDERKLHKTVIPTLGGLGIFAGFVMAMLLGVPVELNNNIQYFMAAIVVVFFLGLKDDILILSATKKFAGQIIAAGILMRFADVRIHDLHGLFGIHQLPNMASIVITMLTIIMITNSFNLIDGVDGLAGSLGVLSTICFGFYFYLAGQFTFAVMAFSLCGGLIGFLIYNFSPAKIFMGDTGSLIVGLVNSILLIKFIQIASNPQAAYYVPAAPAVAFAVLMTPLFDTIRVFSMRILHRRSPFSPDRNHIHHFILDIGLNHRNTTLVCVAANIIFILTAVFLRNIDSTYLSLILLAEGSMATGMVFLLRKKNIARQMLINGEQKEQEIIKTHKVFNLVSEPVNAE